MRISDWSSDVCSSDLLRNSPRQSQLAGLKPYWRGARWSGSLSNIIGGAKHEPPTAADQPQQFPQVPRAPDDRRAGRGAQHHHRAQRAWEINDPLGPACGFFRTPCHEETTLTKFWLLVCGGRAAKQGYFIIWTRIRINQTTITQ